MTIAQGYSYVEKEKSQFRNAFRNKLIPFHTYKVNVCKLKKNPEQCIALFAHLHLLLLLFFGRR